MKIFKKAILPIDFKANGVSCGIKKGDKLDLALFYSSLPASSACLFTANKIKAAPIRINQRHLKNGSPFRAIIANSGNANCFTGKPGLADAQATTEALAEALRIKKENVLLASTGIIGRRLPFLKLKNAIPGLVGGLSAKGIARAKTAIMTTDTFAKEISVKFKLDSKIITLCGVAKGAGMIAPDLISPKSGSRGATMLCFILTDANITKQALEKALRDCAEASFNCITVDGCMSTNDSVMALANGAAENTLIGPNKNFNAFVKALSVVCIELAKMIVRDAEGATKFIRIKVSAARSFEEARKMALAVANSSLFKTAMFGENPNFGRIIAAIGACGIEVKEKDLKIKVSPLEKKDIDVYVSVNRGNAGATVYTSDLAPGYIKINAGYS